MSARWLVTLALCGCGEATPPAADASFELGTGSWRFEALEDGQDVELVHGAQGGWHMWISLRVEGAAVDHPSVRLTMQPVDASLPAQEATLALPFEPEDDEGVRKLIGYTGVVNEPACWVDQRVRVAATLTADDGTELHDEHEVVLRGGVYPPPACDQPP